MYIKSFNTNNRNNYLINLTQIKLLEENKLIQNRSSYKIHQNKIIKNGRKTHLQKL